MYSEELYAERALRAGAVGYINKEEATGKIIEAIRQVLDGKVYLSPAMTEKLLKRSVGQAGGDAGRSPVETLSDRELEVFRLIGQGVKTPGDRCPAAPERQDRRDLPRSDPRETGAEGRRGAGAVRRAMGAGERLGWRKRVMTQLGENAAQVLRRTTYRDGSAPVPPGRRSTAISPPPPWPARPLRACRRRHRHAAP